MKLQKERKHRGSLTLLYSLFALINLMLTMLLAALIILLMVRLDILRTNDGALRTEAFILTVAGSSILIGTALNATVGRLPLRPVNDIINAMNRLASGDYKARLNYSGKLGGLPVIREVETSFNKMASELENTAILRSDFINNFSHEFKTPIVSIAGFAKLLRKGNLSPEEQKEYLQIIEDESLRLSAMATNVLNMTRVENQSILTDVTEYNLSEQLRSCVLLLENKWTRKDLELNLDFEEHSIRANEELMKQVWLNLLDNAVKFSNKGGSLDLAIVEDAGSLSVSVSNTGSEIPEANRERIFQKFYQADESHATEGNGIGLAIVEKIVTLHGGSVKAESLDGRTVFTVILPKSALGEP